jgi:hypothetical protein
MANFTPEAKRIGVTTSVPSIKTMSPTRNISSFLFTRVGHVWRSRSTLARRALFERAAGRPRDKTSLCVLCVLSKRASPVVKNLFLIPV